MELWLLADWRVNVITWKVISMPEDELNMQTSCWRLSVFRESVLG